MSSKIKIKMGAIELEYEGPESFLKDELPDLLKAVSSLYKESGVNNEGETDTNNKGEAGTGNQGPGKITGTTRALAAKLKCKNGPDLIIAACARLSLVLNKKSFSRQDILSEMQSADGYYKKTFSNNLSKYLKTLVSNEAIVESAKDTYALNHKKQEELKKQLAQQ